MSVSAVASECQYIAVIITVQQDLICEWLYLKMRYHISSTFPDVTKD